MMLIHSDQIKNPFEKTYAIELQEAKAKYGDSFDKDLVYVIQELSAHWTHDDYFPGQLSQTPIPQASLAELKNKIAHAIRAEHFYTGAWMSCFKEGAALKFFERLEELGESVDSEAFKAAQKANTIFNS